MSFAKNEFQQLKWQLRQVLKASYHLRKQEYSTFILACNGGVSQKLRPPTPSESQKLRPKTPSESQKLSTNI